VAVDRALSGDRFNTRMAKQTTQQELAGRARPSATSDDYEPTPHKQFLAAAPSWFIPPPHGWRHPVTGRFGWQPEPLLVAFGQYVKRARYLANLSQRELAKKSGVEQGNISRLERALAPATKVERIVRLGAAMGRKFPLGYCPHEHWCQWQPAPEPPPEKPLGYLPPALRAAAAHLGADDDDDDR
jgi:transcriptional regulator with XRE-family HTH domain